MGFSIGMLDKSVFTKQSISKALGRTNDENGNVGGKGGYAVVTISPNSDMLDGRLEYQTIVGVLQDGSLTISLGADWEKMGGAAALTNIPILNALIDVGEIADALLDKGNALINANGYVVGRAMASRKIYKGEGGYLEVSPKIRIVDWNGKGMPILAAATLAQYCLPTAATFSEEVQAYWKKFLDDLKKLKPKPTETPDEASEGTTTKDEKTPTTNGFLAGSTALINDGLKGITNLAKKRFDGVQTALDLKASPPSVSVTIGEYFQHEDMVIENVELSFSKEVTENGPLYLDATIKLSSRYIMNDITQVGFKSTSSLKRVSYADVGVDLTGDEL
jgi:hypothetical protein